MTEWSDYLSYFLGGGLLANASPHFVNGVSGRPFQSPFASPPGKGLSSASVNVVWGFLNGLGAWFLLVRWSAFDIRETSHAAAFGLGVFTTALFLARYLGRFHGGNSPVACPGTGQRSRTGE